MFFLVYPWLKIGLEQIDQWGQMSIHDYLSPLAFDA
jgi:hypothetical protein